MKYHDLAVLYDALDATTKRLEKTELVADFLKKTPADETDTIVLLLQGRVFPAWDEREIGVASQLMVKAISRASGEPILTVERTWKKTGDLGIVAEQLMHKKKQSTLFTAALTTEKVLKNLQKLTLETGKGSVDRKLQLISELLASSDGVEARYITRTTLGVLRVGVGEGVLRDAIVWAYFQRVEDDTNGEKREQYNQYVNIVQTAYDLTNDFAVVAKIAAEKGVAGLKNIKLKLGKPLKVMLALKVDSASDAFNVVGKPAQAEFKYDGFRLEIEKDEKGKIYLFTRRLENVTQQFPDVVAAVKQYVKADTFILDAEVVGYDAKTHKYLPFQQISQRIKRKYDIETISKKFPVQINVFDVLSHNGKTMLAEPFQKRREVVEKIVARKERIIRPSEAIITDNVEEIEAFFDKARAAGNEGLMIKKLDAPYKPGARVGHMLKYKKVVENLDVVIVEAEWGEGKRSKWITSYTLAVDDNGELKTIGKVSTGLKEKPEEGLSFSEMTQLLKPLITKDMGKRVAVTPKIVIEVGYEEIQKSPSYTSGYALRFPRVVRNRTDERGIHDISTLEYVEELYKQQKR